MMRVLTPNGNVIEVEKAEAIVEKRVSFNGKHEKDIIKDINKEDIEFVEKSLRPIERVFGGEVFFKS